MSSQPTQAVALRRTLVPPALAELGVVMAIEEDTGREIVVIPPEVRQKVNVLDPVSSFAQARPDWSPAVRVVQLDPNPEGAHFYRNASWKQGKVALSKQGIELLAKAANVLYTRTRRIPRTDLTDGEILGYVATIGIRRPDGTVEELERSKTYVADAELMEIEEAVARADRWEYDEQQKKRVNQGKFRAGSAEYKAEVRKRWLTEQKNAPAKTESKAVLRAIRAALQIPHQFAQQDAAKPFVVVGFNFTPDQSDPDVRRMLVAAGLNAQRTFYGSDTPSAVVPSPRGELEASSSPDHPSDDESQPAETPASDQAGETASSEGEAGGGAADVVEDAVPASDVGAMDFSDEPQPADEAGEGFAGPAESQELARDAAAAGEVMVPNGVHAAAGRTVRQVAELGAEGEKWLLWALRRWSDDRFRAAVELYVRVHVPDVWEKWQGDKGDES